MKSIQEYKIGKTSYQFDYDMIVFQYNSFKQMSNDEFVKNIIDAIHFACYVSYIKRLDTEKTLSDQGIIHELIHLTKEATRKYQDVSKTRKKFNRLLKINKKNYTL